MRCAPPRTPFPPAHRRWSDCRRCSPPSPGNRRLAWALLAEPVDPLVDAERIAYRARYSELIAASLATGIAAGELPDQNVTLTAAALLGGCAEALVGPLSPVASGEPQTGDLLEALLTFARRAVGA